MGRKFHADERGITPVLGAALLLSIILPAVTIFLAVWVPSETDKMERDHMQEVNASFRELRAVIEGLQVGESKTVSLKMAPDSIPLVPTPHEGGTLSVTLAENVGLENVENFMKSDPGQIRFDWGSWSWVYESGMIIFVQDNVNLMKSAPGLVVVRQVDNKNFEVYYNAVRVNGVGGPVNGTGTSTITVSGLQENRKPPETIENVTIWINSMYKDAWRAYLASESEQLNAIGINSSLDENTLALTIKGGNENIHFSLKVTNIEVRVDR